jgi:hypothetical protein
VVANNSVRNDPLTLRAALASNFTTSSATFVNTNLTFTAAANTKYVVRFVGSGSNDTNSSGARFTLVLPASATMKVVERCQTTAANASTSALLSASADVGVNCWANATGGTAAWATLDGTVTIGATAGAVTVQSLATTSGTVTINAGSYLEVVQVGPSL